MNQERTMSVPIRVSRFVPINAHRLRTLRIERGWTQGELAKVAGYSERLIRKAEASGSLCIDAVRDISEALSTVGQSITVGDLTLDPRFS